MTASRKPPAASRDSDRALADAEAVITSMASILARLVVRSGYGPPLPGFRFAATRQLNVATDAEVDVIESWLSAHPGG